jgi:transposase
MAGKKGMKHYSREVKVEAIRLYFEEGWTQRQIADKLGVSSRKRIEGWVSQYRREGTAAFTRPKGRPRKTEDREAYVARLEMENALLKKYHTELHGERLARRNIGSSTTTEKPIR